MSILMTIDNHALIKVSGQLPFSWFVHAPETDNEKQGLSYWRDQGYIYIAGVSTREQAYDWAMKNGIVPASNPSDDAGEL